MEDCSWPVIQADAQQKVCEPPKRFTEDFIGPKKFGRFKISQFSVTFWPNFVL